MSLQGKNILITGAAVRVGRSLALALAHAGANLILHYGRSQTQAHQLVDEVGCLGGQATALQADLNDPAQVARLIEQAQASAPLDSLINNASIFENLRWDNTTLDDWNRHLMINLTAPFLLSQAFARQVSDNRQGQIVNLLDWRSLRPGADHLPYTVSKVALAGLTRSLAQAFAPRIQVNGIALGAILPASDGSDPAEALRDVPAGRWASLDEVAQTVIFLISGPTYITGEIIHLDGGRHLI